MFLLKKQYFYRFCLVAFSACAMIFLSHDTALSGSSAEPTNLLKQTEIIEDIEDISTQLEDVVSVEHANLYRLNPDDVIDINVYGEGELSKKYTLDENGMISMPLIGNIYVQGLTARQVEQLVATKLKEGFLIDPSVNVNIDSVRPFYILGEVRVPGSYDFVNDMTVLNAVALAGGFTYRANKKEVEILRPNQNENGTYEEVGVKSSVNPGDIILVKERFF